MATMSTREVFKENLKFYRKQNHLTQENLSELIGYGETYITEIESRFKFPKPETIDAIAKVLGIEPYFLFLPPGKKMITESSKEQISRMLKEDINGIIEKHLSSCL